MMNTQTSSEQVNLETQTNYELVNGAFSPDEAAEIIQVLFFEKINFHQRKNFSHQIRFGTQNPQTDERIKELQLALGHAKQRIAEAKESGKTLRINSSIHIELF